MSPTRGSKLAKIARHTSIDQMSQRMRNSARPHRNSKDGREFDPHAFLATIGERRKAMLFPKKQTI
ncbi:MAG: hypothetical protein WAK21_00970, partial [Candidatus Sulfotelmatobacter sp.]